MKDKRSVARGKREMLPGFVAIAVSFVFLFNPDISIIDFLPDIIGYVILYAGLTRLADLSESIADARKYFGYMIIVDGAKLLSLLWVFGLDNTGEHNTALLLLVFVFSLTGLLILIPAFNKLYDGMLTLGYFYEITSIMAKKSEKSTKNRTEKLKNLTLVFLIIKAVVTVLPELTVLSTQAYDEAKGMTDLYEYAPFLRSLSFAIIGVIGIVWLVKSISYFILVSADSKLNKALISEYNEKILSQKGMFILRSLKKCFILFGIGALLCIDFRVEHYNIIPDAAAVLLFVAGLLVFGKKAGTRVYVFGGLALYGVVSALATATEYYFFSKYTYGAVYRNEAAHTAYSVMLSASVADALAFLAAVVCLILFLYRVIINHTGFSVNNSPESRKRVQEVHTEYKKKLILPAVAAVIAAVSDVFCDFFTSRLGFASLINAVTTLFFAIVFIRALSEISEAVQTKYMLD